MAQRTVILGWEASVQIGGPSPYSIGTSTTSNAIGAATVTFTTQALGIPASTPVLLISALGTMWGLTSGNMSSGTSISVVVASGNFTGSGTGTSWWIVPYVIGPVFGVKAGRIDVAIDAEECGDSVTAAAKAFKLGRYGLKANIEFYAKSDIIAFGGGGIITGNGPTGSLAAEISLIVAPNGNSLNNKSPIIVPSLMTDGAPLSWNIDGKLEGSLSGNANGPFQMSA